MSQPTKFQIVQLVDGILLPSEFTSEENLIAGMRVRGSKLTGRESSPSVRAELIGQPKFSGFNGPMYNGPGVVRYESVEAYAELCR